MMFHALPQTFAYQGVIADEHRTASRRVELRRSQPDNRAVGTFLGHQPILETVEYEREPWQLYSRVTLTCTDRKGKAKSLSFALDRELVATWRPGDELHVVRTLDLGLAVSVLRNQRLVAAVGAVTGVPLGRGVSARNAMDIAAEMEAVAHRYNAAFEFPMTPLLVEVDQHRGLITYSGRVGVYDVTVVRPYVAGKPSRAECVAIFQPGVSPDTAAPTSAKLLESAEGFAIT